MELVGSEPIKGEFQNDPAPEHLEECKDMDASEESKEADGLFGN